MDCFCVQLISQLLYSNITSQQLINHCSISYYSASFKYSLYRSFRSASWSRVPSSTISRVAVSSGCSESRDHNMLSDPSPWRLLHQGGVYLRRDTIQTLHHLKCVTNLNINFRTWFQNKILSQRKLAFLKHPTVNHFIFISLKLRIFLSENWTFLTIPISFPRKVLFFLIFSQPGTY